MLSEAVGRRIGATRQESGAAGAQSEALRSPVIEYRLNVVRKGASLLYAAAGGCEWARVDDHQLAAALAGEAGRLLLALREGASVAGDALGMVGDAVANTFIIMALANRRPLDALLSEEAVDKPARLTAPRVWIVDPLDGTREYAEGRDDWAVHVALTEGGRPVAGAVAIPASGRVFGTGAPQSRPIGQRRPVMLVSRTRPPAGARELAERLGAEMRPMGSAGAKAMAVVAGEADLYFHSGGQHEWDNCAPVAVALAAGLHASRIDGAPILYNRADTRVPDLVIGTPTLARVAIEHCRARLTAN